MSSASPVIFSIWNVWQASSASESVIGEAFIRGGIYITSSFRLCGVYWRAALNRRNTVSPSVPESIYKAMIHPIAMYCHQLQLGMPKEIIDKLQSIQNRAAKIVSPRETVCSRNVFTIMIMGLCTLELKFC